MALLRSALSFEIAAINMSLLRSEESLGLLEKLTHIGHWFTTDTASQNRDAR